MPSSTVAILTTPSVSDVAGGFVNDESPKSITSGEADVRVISNAIAPTASFDLLIIGVSD